MRIRLLDDNLPARLNELARVRGSRKAARGSQARCARRHAGTGAARFRRVLYWMFIQLSMTISGRWCMETRGGSRAPRSEVGRRRTHDQRRAAGRLHGGARVLAWHCLPRRSSARADRRQLPASRKRAYAHKVGGPARMRPYRIPKRCPRHRFDRRLSLRFYRRLDYRFDKSRPSRSFAASRQTKVAPAPTSQLVDIATSE